MLWTERRGLDKGTHVLYGGEGGGSRLHRRGSAVHQLGRRRGFNTCMCCVCCVLLGVCGAAQVLQAVLTQYGVPPESFAKVCVIVDKLDKLPRWVVGWVVR